MKLGTKLSIAVYTIVTIMVASSFFVILSTKEIERNTHEALESRVPQIQLVDDIQTNIAMQGLYTRALLIDDSPENQKKLHQYISGVTRDIDDMEALAFTNTFKTYIRELKEEIEAFNHTTEDFLLKLEQGDKAGAADILLHRIQQHDDEILATTDKMVDFQDDKLLAIEIVTKDSVSNTKQIAMGSVIVSIIFSLIIVILVRRTIVRPLKELAKEAQVIAEGDLTNPDIHVRTKDEIGQLAMIFNDMKQNIKSLIQTIQSNAEQLSSSSTALSASTEEITASTGEVTNSLAHTNELSVTTTQSATECASAMDETAIGVQRIAEATQSLHHSATNAAKLANKGNGVVDNAQHQMVKIEQSSTSVSNLVTRLTDQITEIKSFAKVITDITDQTNLLALNAAIEAARAGEYGKGFAVVANEVRKLAENSKQSANSINQLTLDIEKDTLNVEKAMNETLVSVKEGVVMMDDAEHSFTAISDAVQSMSEQIQEVSATAEQLSASTEEVSASVNEMAHGANTSSTNISSITASMEEQTAIMQDVNQVANELVHLATSLQDEVRKFTI